VRQRAHVEGPARAGVSGVEIRVSRQDMPLALEEYMVKAKPFDALADKGRREDAALLLPPPADRRTWSAPYGV